MGVPAHDERDMEFAKKHNISSKHVIVGGKVGLDI
jgi:leucyl-tRNA synthetase